ncbi:tetratricopeptide repeat-containing sensor histidine kinase [Deminuibacter soli]|uniref:histidine kinase n=1 Tax=Deminuibacter soli TaxID=2291815 RepID=A0A3E1NIN0_9BACT|nr:histidine kinase dimerization/phosphoacceptor domain -containing protein [Deminuibacter soli]RFM27638.1 hypothetical protein DXN05_13070 [Deminuibacter soli]
MKQAVLQKIFFSRLLCVLFFLLAAAGAEAKMHTVVKYTVQQLYSMMAASRPDTNRVNVLVEMGLYYLYKSGDDKVDMDSSEYCFNRAITLADSLHATIWRREAQLSLGLHYFYSNRKQEGFDLINSVIQSYYREANWIREGEALRYLLKFYDNLDQRIRILRRMQELAQITGNRVEEIDVQQQVAEMHMLQGKLEQAQSELAQLLPQYKDVGYRKVWWAYDHLSIIALRLGNLNKQLEYAYAGLQYLRASGDTSFIYLFYHRLGVACEYMGKTEESIVYYRKALDACPYGPRFDIMRMLSKQLCKAGRPKEALAVYKQTIHRTKHVAKDEHMDICLTAGDIYFALKEYELAEKNYLQGIDLGLEAKVSMPIISEAWFLLGKFYTDRGQYDKASGYLHKALNIPFGMVEVFSQKEIHLALFRVDSAQGNYASAIKEYQLYKTLNDSIFNVAKSQQMEELEIRYETRRKENDIHMLRQQSVLQGKELQQTAAMRNITLGGIALLLIICGLLFNRYRLKQRSNKALQVKQQALEAKQKEVNEKNESLLNLVYEKEWLLKEVHHRVKNNLQIAISLLSAQQEYLDNEDALAAICNSQHRMQAMSLIHQKLYLSENISLIQMQGYITELVDYLHEQFDYVRNIRFVQDVTPVELDVSQAVPVGLILNEAITNAIKYACVPGRQTVVNISLKPDGDYLLLEIADNGRGLPPDFDASQSNSLGLSLIQALSEQLDGVLQITGTSGVTISVRFAAEHTFERH